MKTTIKFLSSKTISEPVKNEMWNIYQKYYSYSRDYFMQRIPQNTHFAFFYDQEKMIGFTGLRINKIKTNGKKTLLLYFGQAVIETKYRGQNILRRMSIKIGIKYFWDLIFSSGYCWCDTVSFKSYLFFAKSMAEFYPTYKRGTPIQEEHVIYSIGETFYPESFCAFTGTVIKENNFVTDPSAKITQRHLASPDIRFYAMANPGHAKGDGLITIVPMSIKNLFHLAKRMLHRKKRNRKQKYLPPAKLAPILVNNK